MTEEKAAPKRRGRPPKQEAARVRCICDNIWLSTGVKLRDGDEGVEPDADALQVMLDRRNVELVK